MSGNLRQLREDYERLANMYLDVLVKAYELDPAYGDWVGDEVGGAYCNGDTFTVTFNDMISIVDYGIPKDEYLEWLDYCQWAHEFGQPEPNLKAWHAGCPRHGKETMKKLTAIKNELMINIKTLLSTKNCGRLINKIFKQTRFT